MICRVWAFAVGLMIAQGGSAQDIAETDIAPGAWLRGLDKLSGQSTDIEIANGTTAQFGTLQISLRECRYPVDAAVSEAFAGLQIIEAGKTVPAFDGWMIASAPALSALDHSRYDVWVIRCLSP